MRYQTYYRRTKKKKNKKQTNILREYYKVRSSCATRTYSVGNTTTRLFPGGKVSSRISSACSADVNQPEWIELYIPYTETFAKGEVESLCCTLVPRIVSGTPCTSWMCARPNRGLGPCARRKCIKEGEFNCGRSLNNGLNSVFLRLQVFYPYASAHVQGEMLEMLFFLQHLSSRYLTIWWATHFLYEHSANIPQIFHKYSMHSPIYIKPSVFFFNSPSLSCAFYTISYWTVLARNLRFRVQIK